MAFVKETNDTNEDFVVESVSSSGLTVEENATLGLSATASKIIDGTSSWAYLTGSWEENGGYLNINWENFKDGFNIENRPVSGMTKELL